MANSGFFAPPFIVSCKLFKHLWTSFPWLAILTKCLASVLGKNFCIVRNVLGFLCFGAFQAAAMKDMRKISRSPTPVPTTTTTTNNDHACSVNTRCRFCAVSSAKGGFVLAVDTSWTKCAKVRATKILSL